MKKELSRRCFLGTAGKAIAGVASSQWLCEKVCGAVGNSEACVYAVCGIYCGACEGVLASMAAMKTSDIKCLGCRSRKAPAKCDVRNCARSKKLQSCGLCKSYPCQKIKSMFNDNPKYGLMEKYLNTVRDKGLQAWLDEMKERWTCRKCKARFGYGMKVCPKCGEKVYSDEEEFEEFKRKKT